MTAPRRRWSFTLRTLFVAVTVLCVVGRWVAYQLTWIRERHRLQGNGTVRLGHNMFLYPPTKAPSGLWMFGEKGCYELFYRPEGADEKTVNFFYRLILRGEPPEPLSVAELKRVQSIFPEAHFRPFTEDD